MIHCSVRRCAIAVFFTCLSCFQVVAEGANLPNGIVHLREVDPSIVQDIRYAGPLNFTGAQIPGYGAAECVLVREAAEALRAVQADLRKQSLGLKVFDCYRPARAVTAFVTWTAQPEDPNLKNEYHPRLSKDALIPKYIARRSGHSRGAAVDLTIVQLSVPQIEPSQHGGVCRPSQTDSSQSSELDMGTGFDCFDVLSRTKAPGITDSQRSNRTLLLKAMRRHGFRNYAGEWWHYSLHLEPFPNTYFDFPIPPAPNGNK